MVMSPFINIFYRLLLADMLGSRIENAVDMSICQGIINGFALAAEFDKSRLLENAKLVGNRGNGHSQDLGNVANAKLGVKQRIQDANTRAVPEDLIEIGKRKQLLGVWQKLLRMTDTRRMRADFPTIRCCIFHKFASFISSFEQLFKYYYIKRRTKSQ